MHLFATTTAKQTLELGKGAAFVEVDKPAVTRRSGAAATSGSRAP
jgi:hypothetical protein